MCEFRVTLDNKTIFQNAVHAKILGNKIVVQDAIGSSLELEDCAIIEVDIKTELLSLIKVR